ncbi:MAG: VWA domain-containing protein [Gammaproteobacteria bacterium]|nr:VWA domain-containing protein [Gammaproteobacteria bacterium]
MNDELLAQYQSKFTTGFEIAQEVFPECLEEAVSLLSPEGVDAYIEGANFLFSMGTGVEPGLAYLVEMPAIASQVGIEACQIVPDFAYSLVRSPSKKAVLAFIECLPTVARVLENSDDFKRFIEIIRAYATESQEVVSGHYSRYESPGLGPLFKSIPQLISLLNVDGLDRFISFGLRNYCNTPDEQIAYFSLESPDARAIINREREGTAFKQVERQLTMLKDAFWDNDLPFLSFTTGFKQLRKPVPYLDDTCLAVPDVFQDENGVAGVDIYHATVAHMMGHYQWSEELMADNFAPHMQLFISTFEDSRIEYLAMKRFPGLRKLFMQLHPYPEKGSCDSTKFACLRYRATRLSRAILDKDFDAENELIETFKARFYEIMDARGEETTTKDMVKLGSDFYIQSRKKSDSLPGVFFDDTEISYRDDNRVMWMHHEESDEAEDYNPNEYESEDKLVEDDGGLPPRRYDEWDYVSESYRPEWTTVYERLHPSGDAGKIDRLMEKHGALAKRLKKMIEMLKPQNKKRIRFQEEGEELDLDIALRSIIDFKSGQVPDPRINYSHVTDSRDIAVMLLVDTSQSLNERNPETGQTLLELSEEALAITAWTIEQLGDKFAIAGFCSDTRQEVRYEHIKGFSEHYCDTVKSRIAAMEASYSTRMGPAMRHAAHYLEGQSAEKKILLILTDGEPADIDTKDPQVLIQDTKMAVRELKDMGIHSYCITLDPKADEYVADIFGNSFTVIDHVEKLPEQLPQVFMTLTS